MEVELSAQPVTDLHCFLFPQTPVLTRASLADIFTAGGPTVMGFRPKSRASDLGATVAYRRLIHELARYLGCRKEDSEVIERRNEEAKDFPEYVKGLFEDAEIRRVVVDNGLEPVTFEEFRSYAPASLYRVYRIEVLTKRLLDGVRTFGGLLDSFETEVRAAIKERGFSGFKTVIAYRTGLDIGVPSEAEAKRSFRMLREGKDAGEWFGPRAKALRGYLLRRAAEITKELGVFLQIHTGVGDTDIIGEKCNPLLLQSFLKSESVSGVPVILVHGGFPYSMEAAWLANVFPNVYFELSTPLPPSYLPAVSKARFKDILEMVPTTRIVYGSDSHDIPEKHWFSAKVAKRALAGALDDLVSEGVMEEEEALEAAERILNSNALELLG